MLQQAPEQLKQLQKIHGLHIFKHFSIYFSYLGECCNTVLPWSSRNVLWTAKWFANCSGNGFQMRRKSPVKHCSWGHLTSLWLFCQTFITHDGKHKLYKSSLNVGYISFCLYSVRSNQIKSGHSELLHPFFWKNNTQLGLLCHIRSVRHRHTQQSRGDTQQQLRWSWTHNGESARRNSSVLIQKDAKIGVWLLGRKQWS